jgi:accessory colonization factor AcfC
MRHRTANLRLIFEGGSNVKQITFLLVTVATLAGVVALTLGISRSAAAHEVPDPSIIHNARDGVVRLYGAGGPDTAFKKVAEVFTKETGIKVEIVAGPEPTWSRKAQADADILWGTAEEDITALLETYKDFAWDDVTPIYIRPAIIAVKKDNPKRIRGFEDLLKDGMKIVVTEGAGVANTSGTGTWEDVAGREGRLEDIKRFRKNIVGFGKGSGPSYKMFIEKDADAWITWPDWPITHPDKAEIVPLSKSRTIWRDVNVVLAHDADPQAKEFLNFLTGDRAAAIMKTEGWVR